MRNAYTHTHQLAARSHCEYIQELWSGTHQRRVNEFCERYAMISCRIVFSRKRHAHVLCCVWVMADSIFFLSYHANVYMRTSTPKVAVVFVFFATIFLSIKLLFWKCESFEFWFGGPHIQNRRLTRACFHKQQMNNNRRARVRTRSSPSHRTHAMHVVVVVHEKQLIRRYFNWR